jgi:hypothetical protein
MPGGMSPAAILTAVSAASVGTASGGGNTSLIDARKNWVVNQWVGSKVQIIKPDGREYFCSILTNTATQMNFAALTGGVSVAPGDFYIILSSNDPAGARLIRWGRDVTPTWIYAAEVPGPGLGAVLVTQGVGAGHVGYIYGFFISVGEGNDFLLNWTSGGLAYHRRMVFGAGGTVEAIDQIPLNEGLGADGGTNITITNVNAGGVAIVYQANLLYAEV